MLRPTGFSALRRLQDGADPAPAAQGTRGYQIQNDNKLLFEYPGAIGGKTGFTDIARHTFVGAATRGGRTLVVTMLGGEHKPVRSWQQGAALLDWGFANSGNSSVGRLVNPGEGPTQPSATPTAAVKAAAAGNVGADAGMSRRTAGFIGAGLTASFVVVWLALLVAARRRRVRHS